MSCLQFFLKARDVVLSKLHNHTTGVDELVLLGPGCLELRHFLKQHLNTESDITVRFPAQILFLKNVRIEII